MVIAINYIIDFSAVVLRFCAINVDVKLTVTVKMIKLVSSAELIL